MQKVRTYIRQSSILPILLVLTVIAGALVTIFVFSLGIYHYDIWDYLEDIFWADATLRSGTPLNPSYIYYYTVPFGPNYIMAPFVSMLGTSVLANQLGMIVFLIIYVTLAFRLAKTLFPDEMRSRLIFVGVMSLFVYTYVGDNLLHHILPYGMAFLCTIGEISCIIEIDRKGKSVRDMLLLILLSLWSGLNGFSAVLSTLPVLAALALLSFINGTLFRKQNFGLLSVMFTSVVSGLLIYAYCDHAAVTLGKYKARFILNDASDVAYSITQKFIRDYLRCFSFDPKRDGMFSPRGIFALIKLAFAIALIVLPILLLKREKKEGYERDPEAKLLFLSSLFIIAVCTGEFILVREAVPRYLFNGILSAFTVLAYLFARYIKQTGKIVWVLIVCVFAMMMTAKTTLFTYREGREEQEKYIRISNVIEEEGLVRGYTLDRFYKVLDVISGGNCYNTVTLVDEEEGKVYIEQSGIYLWELNKPEYVKQYYFVVSKKDYEEYGELLGGWTEQKDIGDVYLLIYEISYWDSMFEFKELDIG